MQRLLFTFFPIQYLPYHFSSLKLLCFMSPYAMLEWSVTFSRTLQHFPYHLFSLNLLCFFSPTAMLRMSSAFFPTQLHIGGSLDLHSIRKIFSSKATLKDFEAAEARESDRVSNRVSKSPNENVNGNIFLRFDETKLCTIDYGPKNT